MDSKTATEVEAQERRKTRLSMIPWEVAPEGTAAYYSYGARDMDKSVTKAMWVALDGSLTPTLPAFAMQDGEGPFREPKPVSPVAGGFMREGENPHSHNVSGYRKMSDVDNWINLVKAEERLLAGMVKRVEETTSDVDGRCIAIAKTRFEEAFMFLVEAIAKPADPYR